MTILDHFHRHSSVRQEMVPYGGRILVKLIPYPSEKLSADPNPTMSSMIRARR